MTQSIEQRAYDHASSILVNLIGQHLPATHDMLRQVGPALQVAAHATGTITRAPYL